MKEITQGKFRVEFPEELTQEEIDAIRMMVVKLLERNNCKVVPVEQAGCVYGYDLLGWVHR